MQRVEVDGVRVSYRGAGDTKAPAILLLHRSQLRRPCSANSFRAERKYEYTFDQLALTVDAFVKALKLNRYAIYVFDCGPPTGFRLAMAHPDRVTAIITQNGNAYEEGLGDAWGPIRKDWAS